jgi:RNA polymerase sigma-70 factor (ECF subfamily)
MLDGAGDSEAEACAAMLRLQAGDRGAAADLFRIFAAPLLRVATWVLRDPEAAEDVVQDVFCEIGRISQQFDASRGSVGGLLTITVRRRAIDRQRRQRRVDLTDPHAVLELADAGARPVGGPAGTDLLDLTAGLPLSAQRVIWLRYRLDLRLEEIAALLEREPATVRQIHARGLRALASA